MSNELKKIVREIQFLTDKTIEEIAVEVGYARAYFNNQVNIGTNKTLKDLLANYLLDIKQKAPPPKQSNNEELSGSQVIIDPVIYNTVLPLGDLRVTLKDYVELLKDKARKAEEREQRLLALLEKDIGAIKTNSQTIQADLEVLTGIVRSDDEVMLKGTDRILGREEGASSQEAGIGELAFSVSDKVDHTSGAKGKKDNSNKGSRQRKA